MTFVRDHVVGRSDFIRSMFEVGGVRFRGARGSGLCPFHADHNPSFSVNLQTSAWECFACGEKGDLVTFHAKAHRLSAAEAIDALGAQLGLGTGKLRGGPKIRRVIEGGSDASVLAPAQPVHPGLTLANYARAKRLSLEFLQRLGLRDVTYLGRPAIRIPYHDVNGQEVAVRFRLEMAKGSTDVRFRWRQGSKPGLYGLDQIARARERCFVVLVEGESDSHTLWNSGFPAFGIPGASSWREDRDSLFLDGFETVYIAIEPDTGGEAVKKWLARSRIRDRAMLLDLGGFKDASDLFLDNPSRFAERFRAAMAAARPWSSIEGASCQEKREESWEICRPLASEKCILDRLSNDLARIGVVGEDRTARILFLAVVSRFLERPVSIVLKGTSSSGKSFLVERVLRFFDPSAYYALSAMSEHALAYSEEPLSHRTLVIYEAAGMEGDLTTYFMRSLLSENRIRYETVERTEKGIKPRLIEREGPTGLIVTTTRSRLHPENETRLLSITTTDTPEQTRRILAATAISVGTVGRVADFEPWRALDRWLTTAEHRVEIPFASRLAEAIPALAVRLRRDFRTVLSLIAAHAILHQTSRERDASGAIVASIGGDYAPVRDLISDLISEGIEATIPPSVRSTVLAVREIASEEEPTTLARLAAWLKLDKSAASRRVHASIELGFIRNLAEKRGQPLRLIPGEPLPDDLPILPEPAALLSIPGYDPATVQLPQADHRLQGCAAASRDSDPLPLATGGGTGSADPVTRCARVSTSGAPGWETV